MTSETLQRLRFLTRQDLAEITGHSLVTVDRWLHDPDEEARLPSFRPGGGTKILIRIDDFEAWLERNRTHGPAGVRATMTKERRARRAAAKKKTAKKGSRR